MVFPGTVVPPPGAAVELLPPEPPLDDVDPPEPGAIVVKPPIGVVVTTGLGVQIVPFVYAQIQCPQVVGGIAKVGTILRWLFMHFYPWSILPWCTSCCIHCCIPGIHRTSWHDPSFHRESVPLYPGWVRSVCLSAHLEAGIASTPFVDLSAYRHQQLASF